MNQQRTPPRRTVTNFAAPPSGAADATEAAADAVVAEFSLRDGLIILARAVAKALAHPSVVTPLTNCVRGACVNRPRVGKMAVRFIRVAQSQAEEL